MKSGYLGKDTQNTGYVETLETEINVECHLRHFQSVGRKRVLSVLPSLMGTLYSRLCVLKCWVTHS